MPAEIPPIFRADVREPLYKYNYIKENQINISRFHGVVYKHVLSEIYEQSYVQEARKCVENIGGNRFSLPYKSLIVHPYNMMSDCQPLDLTTRIIFGPLSIIDFKTEQGDNTTQGKLQYGDNFVFTPLTYRYIAIEE